MVTRIPSKDGTSIGCRQSGAGPPLVLVHGTSAAATRWGPVLPLLEPHFTLLAMDRRGRGHSGDSDNYVIEREFEDVAAVVDALPGPVDLLGHSYGALCALEASLLASNIRRLILYEPPLSNSDSSIDPAGVIERLQALLDAGDREAVVITFMREVVHMPAHELDVLQAAPAFQDRIAAAHTLPRELRAHEQYRFHPDRFREMKTPTLLLLGGDSPPFFRAALEAVNAALPRSRIAVLPGQQHIAIDTGPKMFAQEVVRFLQQDEGASHQ